MMVNLHVQYVSTQDVQILYVKKFFFIVHMQVS